MLLDGLLGSFDVMVYWGDRNRGSDCMKAGGSGRSARIHDLTNCMTSLVTQWDYNCAGSLLLMVSSLLPFVASACSKGWFRKARAKWTSCWDVMLMAVCCTALWVNAFPCYGAWENALPNQSVFRHLLRLFCFPLFPYLFVTDPSFLNVVWTWTVNLHTWLVQVIH